MQVVYQVSFFVHVGCVADSHELSRWFGDDTRVRAASYEANRAGLPMMRFLLGHLAAGGSSLQRISMVGRFMSGGFRVLAAAFLLMGFAGCASSQHKPAQSASADVQDVSGEERARCERCGVVLQARGQSDRRPLTDLLT